MILRAVPSKFTAAMRNKRKATEFLILQTIRSYFSNTHATNINFLMKNIKSYESLLVLHFINIIIHWCLDIRAINISAFRYKCTYPLAPKRRLYRDTTVLFMVVLTADYNSQMLIR